MKKIGNNKGTIKEYVNKYTTFVNKNSKKTLILSAIACVVFALLLFCSIGNTFKDAIINLWQKFDESYMIANRKAHDEYFEKGYTAGFNSHKVEVDTLISIEEIKEQTNLHILQVEASDVIKYDENNIVSWVCFNASGSYEIDLSKGEYIVDASRKYVYAKIPKPSINTDKVAIEEVEQYLYDDNNLFEKNEEGIEVSTTMRSKASKVLKSKLLNDDRCMKKAEETAIRTVKQLIETLNFNVKDLNVIVEYYE